MTKLLMVDVSSNNGPIDVKALHDAGYGAIGVKATEGTSYTNPYYAATVDAAHRLGMAAVHYHFPVAGEGSIAQADYFLKTVRPHLQPRRDQLTLDMESMFTGKQWAAGQPKIFSDSFMHFLWDRAPRFGLLQRRVRRLIYGPPYFLRGEGISPKHGEGLWIASLGGSNPVFIPKGWRTWTAWQFTWTATVPGVRGKVDESHIRPSVLRRSRLYPTLRFGAKGTAVRLLQHLLRDRGVAPHLAVTGTFDAATRAAVNDVHRRIGNRQTGVAGPFVWRYLTRVPKS